MKKPLFVHPVSARIWNISSSPWRWCLFEELLEAVNNLCEEVGDPPFTSEKLWNRFFDLSVDIDSQKNRRIEWTTDGIVYRHVVDFGPGADLPKTNRFFIPAGWYRDIIKYVEKGGRWVEDVTPHPSGIFPKRRLISIHAGEISFNLVCVPNKGLFKR